MMYAGDEDYGDDVTSETREDEESMADETYESDEYDPFLNDSDADADVLRSIGWGTDEDYGYYGDE
jgi:hypothetical protein